MFCKVLTEIKGERVSDGDGNRIKSCKNYTVGL